MENINILEEKENPLYNRKEIKIIGKSKINPNKIDSEKLISEKFSKPVENIVIKKIKGKFGRDTFLITANIYNSKEDKEKTEFKSKKEKEVEAKLKEEEAKKAEQEKQEEEAKKKAEEAKVEPVLESTKSETSKPSPDINQNKSEPTGEAN